LPFSLSPIKDSPGFIPVEIVELPPTITGDEKIPGKVERYAQRSQSVKKEVKPKRKLPIISLEDIYSRRGATESGKRPSDNGDVNTKGTDLESKEKHTLPLLSEEWEPANIYPSKDRLAELSRNYEDVAPKAEEGKILALNTSEHKYWYFIAGIKRKIELQWDYPDVALKKGQQGKLFISFSIKRDGGLDSIDLVRGSGYPILDNAALTAVRLAAPFNPFPKTFEINRVTIQASFEYILERLNR
jgi:TonB family protein